MVITQKEQMGKKTVEYTDSELKTLLTTMCVSWASCLIAGVCNSAIGAITLAQDYENWTWVIALGITTCIAVGVWLIRPLAKMALRHVSLKPSEKHFSVKEVLKTWYASASYARVMVVLVAGSLVNGGMLAYESTLSSNEIGAYVMLGIGTVSTIVLILWAAASFTLEDSPSKYDILVIKIPWNA